MTLHSGYETWHKSILILTSNFVTWGQPLQSACFLCLLEPSSIPGSQAKEFWKWSLLKKGTPYLYTTSPSWQALLHKMEHYMLSLRQNLGSNFQTGSSNNKLAKVVAQLCSIELGQTSMNASTTHPSTGQACSAPSAFDSCMEQRFLKAETIYSRPLASACRLYHDHNYHFIIKGYLHT